ncbi:LCP family protein [Nocardioides pacificus]
MNWFNLSLIGTRHRAVRLLLTSLFVVGALAALAATAGAFYLHHQLNNRVERIGGVFEGLEDRPVQPSAGPAAKAINILFIGSAGVATTDAEDSLEWLPRQSADSVMVLHIEGDRSRVSVISIPHDALIEAPVRRGVTTVEDAVSGATPSTAIQTVEELTDVRMNHLAVLDWTGLEDVVDVAGVTLDEPSDLHDPIRQQALIEQLVSRVLTSASSRDVLGLREQREAITGHLSVDEDWSSTDMVDLAMSLRELEGDDVDYLSAPVVHHGSDGGIKRLDETAGRQLWAAVRDDAGIRESADRLPD